MREGYRKLNKTKLNAQNHKVISMQEALTQITPMQFIEDVYNGNKKVQIDKQGVHYLRL